MRPVRARRAHGRCGRLLLAVLGLLIVAACRMNEAEGDQYLRLNLSPSLAGYDRVRIDLVSPQDSGVVYEEIWNAKLEDPAGFPRHKLTAARGRDFVIRIRAYDAQGGLAMAKDVEVRGRQARPTVVIRPDIRLFALEPSRGELYPPFHPETGAYSLDLPDSVSSLGFTVTSMDGENNSLSLDGKEIAWGTIPSRTLVPGSSTFTFVVQGKQGGTSRTYVVSVRYAVNQAGAPRVRILSPVDGLVTNRDTLPVSWTVDSVAQAEGTREILAPPDGIKLIVREKRGPDGKVGLAEVWVTRDTQPPRTPRASAVTPTASTRPEWSWGPVEGGDGFFRFRLDTADLADMPPSEVLAFAPARNLAPGVHTLYLQARDAAGNWSATDSFPVTVLGRDTVRPEPPRLRGSTPTNAQPKWIWSPGGGDGSGDYEYKIGNGDFSSGATATRDTVHVLPGTAVSNTLYTLYVREQDAAGNWSEPAHHGIHYDASKPSVAIQSPRESGIHYFSDSVMVMNGTAQGPNPIVKVTYRLDAGAPKSADLDSGRWSIPGLALAEGVPVKVTVAAEDKLGNSSEALLTLHRDTTLPGAPTLVNQPPANLRVPKGTWTWTAGADGPTGSGLSGRFRHRLNNGPWVVTEALSAADLALADGANLFSVQNEDMAGNWSLPAQSAAKVDSTKPLLAVTSPAANPATLSSLKVTLSGTVSDAGSGVASVTVSGYAAGSPNATVSGNTWTSAELTLRAGANELRVTATDGLGNSAAVTLAVTVTLSVPSVVITYPPDFYATNRDTVTLRYRVDGGQEITASAPETLPVGVSVHTVYSAPNGEGVRGSASVNVLRDTVPPSAPTLTAASALTKGDPVWNWTLAEDDIDGGGMAVPLVYRYRVNGGAPIQVADRTFRLTGAAEGRHSLSVAQLDRAGNWGAYSPEVAVVIDRTPPVVIIQSPRDTLVTNRDSVTVTYTEQDGTGPVVLRTKGVRPPSGGSAVLVSVTATDSALNTGIASVTIIRRANVLFVRPAATGVADGSSWSDALGSISAALSLAASGTQIWVSGGSYLAPATDSGFPLKSNLSIYGGFNAGAHANLPGQRVFAAADTSVISRTNSSTASLFSVRGTTTYLNTIVVDGFKLMVGPSMKAVDLNQVSGITLRNLQFVTEGSGSSGKAIETYLGSTILGENLKFSRFLTLSYVVKVSGSMDFKNIEFSGNTIPPEAAAGALVTGGRDMTFDGCRFLDAIPSTARHIEHGSVGNLNVVNTAFRLATPAGGMAAAVRTTSPDTVFLNNTFMP